MNSSPNNPKRDHHTIPQLYLKGFVIKQGEPFIWIYKRGESYNPGNFKIRYNPCRTSIKSASVIKDYYANPKPEGVMNSADYEMFENKLALLEEQAIPIFAKLRNQKPITREDKEHFSVYIVQMFRRVPAGRAMVERASKSMDHEPSKKLLEKLQLPDTPEARQFVKAMKTQQAQKDGFGKEAHLHIATEPEPSRLVP